MRPNVWKNLGRGALILVLVLTLGPISMSERAPASPGNLCEVFREKPHWYQAAKKSAADWGGNIHVPMAMMFHESGFRARATTPMQYRWGWLPIGYRSSAYGYAQAIDSTWRRYQKGTGYLFSWRNRFSDAIDFMQWYMEQTRRINQISKRDAYRQYLNYHEGQIGYKRGSYKKKKWLLGVAKKVSQRADRYARQMQQCPGLG